MTSSFQRMFKAPRVLALLSLFLLAGPSWALAVGDKAPSFTVPSLRDNSILRMSAYRGKVVYLEFWASWCPPCWDSFPKLEQLRQDFKDEGLDGFEVVGINVNDSLGDAMDATGKLKASFPLARPPDDKMMHAFGVTAMPYGVLIDRNGRVSATYLGLGRSDLRELKKNIRRLLWTGQ